MDDQGAGVPLVLSPLGQWAAQAHEMYQSLVEAGFEDDAALAILVGMTRQTNDEE
jgi:hypothetical protein